MSDLTEAIKILKEGGIVIYPTDTAFGIGCRIDNPASVKRLFDLRKRPVYQAVPILVSSAKMAEKYYLSPLPYNVRLLMKEYWPGGLTIVYNCQTDLIPPLVRGGSDTVGLRMPNHQAVKQLIEGVGVPILGPSANFHGQPTPFSFDQLDKKLMKLADYVLDGECRLKQASTVIDCTVSPFKVIRQGAVKIEQKFLQ